MRSPEHYETQKAQKESREQRKRDAAKQESREASLANIRFWRHPDHLVRYTGWLQAYTFVLSAATFALFIATGVSAVILYNTDNAIHAQLDEMKTDSAIRKYELMAKMQFNVIRYYAVSPSVFVTPQWVNVGKTDAINFKGWDKIKVFTSAQNLDDIDFRATPTDEKIREDGDVVATNEGRAYRTEEITESQAWDSIYKIRTVISWGYAEYRDIFGTFHAIHHCHIISIGFNGEMLVMHLPMQFKTYCNTRT